jgi:hypothetical protein
MYSTKAASLGWTGGLTDRPPLSYAEDDPASQTLRTTARGPICACFMFSLLPNAIQVDLRGQMG